MRGMMRRMVLVGVSGWAVISHSASLPAAAQPAARHRGLLARIPASAEFYVYTASVTALEAKIRLVESRMNSPRGFDPIDAMMRAFGPASALDFNKPAAIAVLSWPGAGAMMAQPSVAAFLGSRKPAATLAALGAKSVGKGIYRVRMPQMPMPMFLAVLGHYMVLSNQAASVRKCLAAKAFLGSQLSPIQRHFFTSSDLAVSLHVAPLYRLVRQQRALMAQANGVGMKKKKAPVNLSGTRFYKRAFELLENRALRQLMTQVPRVMFTVRLGATGIFYSLIAIPRSGTAMAKLIHTQRALGKKPFVGLPAGRYIAAGAATFNGAAVAAWLHRSELVWDQHVSIRSRKRYPQLKKQMDMALQAVADVHGLSLINYAENKAVGQNGLGIQVVQIDHAGLHLHQILAWLKHPTGLGATGWANWTITPAARNISGIEFAELVGKVPSKLPMLAPWPFSVLSPQSAFGAKTVSMYAGVIRNRIIFADAHAVGKLPEVVEQIQKHRENLRQLPEIAALSPLEPTHARLLMYLPLARWASLAREQRHPGAGKPIVGAVVIGAPVPPLLISGEVRGGCMVYRAYMAYSLMSTINHTSLQGGFPF